MSDEERVACSVRTAVLGDAKPIFEMIRAHSDMLVPRSIGDIVENIDRFVIAENEEGRLIGCASWKIFPEIGNPEGAAVEIQSVAVAKEYRRKKIGEALVSRVIDSVRRFNASQVIVLTFAPEFFKSMGFVVIPKTQVMHKLYIGCMGCTKHANPFTCPEIAMAFPLH